MLVLVLLLLLPPTPRRRRLEAGGRQWQRRRRAGLQRAGPLHRHLQRQGQRRRRGRRARAARHRQVQHVDARRDARVEGGDEDLLAGGQVDGQAQSGHVVDGRAAVVPIGRPTLLPPHHPIAAVV